MGTGRQNPQPGADPAPALPIASCKGWVPLTPNGVAAYAGSPLKRVVVLQAISGTLCTLAIAWILVASVFPTLRQALQNLPDQGLLTLGELRFPENTPFKHPLATSTWLAVDVDPTTTAHRNASRDLDLIFTRSEVRLISTLGTARIPYPPLWHLPFNRLEMLAAWEAWEGMLYGALLLASFATLMVSWWLLATVHCLLPRILAYFTDRELNLGAAWKLTAAALIPGAALMVMGLVALEADVMGGVQFALLFVIHFLVPIVYSLLATCHLPPRAIRTAHTKNPFVPPPASGAPEEDQSVSKTSSTARPPRKPANPFARID